jgi:hypothetical protein
MAGTERRVHDSPLRAMRIAFRTNRPLPKTPASARCARIGFSNTSARVRTWLIAFRSVVSTRCIWSRTNEPWIQKCNVEE